MTRGSPRRKLRAESATVKNQARLAAELGVHRSTIARYVNDGLRPQSDGRFDIAEARAWHEQAMVRMKAGTSRRAAALTFDEEYRKFKAAKMKQEFAISSGELVSRSEVKRAWAVRLLQVRDGFLYLGREVAPQLVGRSPMEIQATIDHKVVQILAHLSREEGAENKSSNGSI